MSLHLNQPIMEITLKAFIATLFVLAVISKLSGKSKELFEKSYGTTFMYVIAVLEFVFAAGLFTRWDWWSACGLLVIIIGAIVTLVRQQVKPQKYTMALITTAFLVLLLNELK